MAFERLDINGDGFISVEELFDRLPHHLDADLVEADRMLEVGGMCLLHIAQYIMLYMCHSSSTLYVV